MEYVNWKDLILVLSLIYLLRNHLEIIFKFMIYLVCVILTGLAFSDMSSLSLFTSVIFAIITERMINQSCYWLKRAKDIIFLKAKNQESLIEKFNYVLYELNSFILIVITGLISSRLILMPVRRVVDLEILIAFIAVVYSIRLVSINYEKSSTKCSEI